MRAIVALFSLGAVLAGTPIVAGAEGAGRGGSTTPPTAVSPDAFRRLKTNDPAQIKAALDDVRMAGRGGAAAVPTIVEALRLGLPPTLTLAAIETLGDTENEGASEVVAWYARHRNVAIRRAAVEALAKTRGSLAVKALRAGLSDSDPGVRGLSATALGSLKVHDALGDLFAALDHGVAEAAVSIGELCLGHECERLTAKLGALPFDVVTSGLDEILLRPVTEITDEQKLAIIGRVRELGTGEANAFLKDTQGKWPPQASKRVKQALDQAVLATSGSPGTAPPRHAP